MKDRNKVAGIVCGSVVQAQVVQGDLHLHSSSVLVVPRQLPRCAATVVGRGVELAKLNRLLDGPESTAVVSGAAGIGKTTVCLRWARSVAKRFPDGQLHVDLRGFDPMYAPLTPAEAVRGFLDGFGVPPERIPPGQKAQLDLYRSITADRRVLVVLDNVRDVQQVRNLLPGGSGCVVVISSRTELSGLVVSGQVRRIKLGLLSDVDARQLISRRLDGVPTTSQAVGALAEQCGGLPLALAIVAGRAAEDRTFPLDVLVDELRSESQRLDGLDTGDPYTTVRNVFSWSYLALPTAARRMFRLLGLMIGTTIALPGVASLAGVPVIRARAILIDLSRANLVEEHLPGRYRFHDLLREYALERLVEEEPESLRTAATSRLLDSYLRTAMTVDAVLSPHRLRTAVPTTAPGVVVIETADYREALDWCAAEHQSLVGAVSYAFRHGQDRHAWQLAWALVTYLRRFGHHGDRERTQRIALTAARRLGDGHAEAKISRVLGKTLVGAGRHRDAEVFLERAIVLFEQLGDAAEESDALLGRGRAHHEQGRLDDASSDARRALVLAESADNANLRATALNAIGRNMIALGDPGEGIAHCTAALALYGEIGNSEGAADALRMLGWACYLMGEFDEAVTHYQASLELDLALGDEFYAALVLAAEGDAHLAAGRRPTAVAAWRRAVELLDGLGSHEAERVRTRLRTIDSS